MMKKLVLFISLTLFFVTAFAQNEKVYTNSFTIDAKTYYSFQITVQNREAFLMKAGEAWGTPVHADPGGITWDEIQFAGLSHKISVFVKDGIFTTKKNVGTFVAFKNEKDKQKKLSGLKENQSRWTVVELKGEDGNFAVLTDEEQAAVKTFLLHVVSDIE